jgi:drug/metabolite transporter (DMT)-like permease
MTLSRPAYFALVLTFCLLWASAFSVTKFVLPVSPPLLFLGIRFLVAGAILVGVAAIRGELRAAVHGRIPWAALLGLGLLNQALYQGLSWEGMRSTSAGLATIIVSTNPILIAVVAAPMLGERLGARRLLGLLLGLGGVAFIVRDRIAVGESWHGVAFLAGALAAMVAGTIAFKRMHPSIPLAVSVGAQQLGAGAVLLATGLLTEDRGRVILGTQYALTMAWFVLAISVGALMLWFFLLRRGSAGSASALHFLIPPIGLLINWATLGERVGLIDLIGVVPVVLGIWLATRPARPRTEAALAPEGTAAPAVASCRA